MLREEHRFRVFENRVLRGIFGPRRDEVTEQWRKLHNGDFYVSPNIIRMIKSRKMRGRPCRTNVVAEKHIQNCDLKTWREEKSWKT
jgi:hypothetical protein